ncbi:MAG: amidase domain-containing protein [Clostridiales bacterium]|nr:amidase domain-containing protein [Clostridiales bacterium]
MADILPYDRQSAVTYAHRWAYGRNPAFYDFQNLGGDCTNFASQCLYAGTGIMNFTPVFGWYYRSVNDRAPSWTGVIYFYNFLVRTEDNTGPFAIETGLSECLPGDFVQLSFDGVAFGHTPVIVEIGTPPTLDNTLVAAHTNDADYRPLSTYDFRLARYLHILGARG